MKRIEKAIEGIETIYTECLNEGISLENFKDVISPENMMIKQRENVEELRGLNEALRALTSALVGKKL